MRWNIHHADAPVRSWMHPLFSLCASSAVIGSAVLLTALPAFAGKLQTWRFDAGSSQLEFTTDEGVQPSAQLIANPTRLLIDLPGTTFGKPQTSQPVNSQSIRSVRVGQFDKTTTRIVVELEPGYTIDPNQVQFRGITPRQWTVKIPTPQPGTPPTNPPTGTPPTNPPTDPGSPTANTQIQNVQVTGDGFFIRTSGQAPQLRVNRSADRRQIDVDFLGASISPSASPRDIIVNKRGVNRAILSQAQGVPPIARLTLAVDPTSPDWQATYSDLGGVVLLPTGATPPVDTTRPVPGKLTTIQTVDLDERAQQVVIAGDQPLAYTAGWDRGAGFYKVTLNNAQLAKNIRGPQLNPNSSLLQVRLRQETPQTVAVLLSPAAGIQISPPLSTSRQSIAIPLTRSTSRPPVTFPTDGTIIPVPPTQPGGLPIPRPPVGRGVVVIDPGHGGPDPGAVGIGNIYEKDIVMDISRQVTAILQQNGVPAMLTRDRDYELDLQPRVDIAERANASLFVSIHANAISLSRPDVNGLETYYYSSGEGLARAIHANVLRNANVADRSVRKGRFYVLRRTSMPSVLVETGFVTGAQDAANFANPTHRRQMAEGIARGIMQYLRGGS